jgi:hypothetical protein
MGIVDILSAPPGSLIYHLITLFGIQAVFGMALDEWQRRRQSEFQRLVFAFGVMLAARLLLMVAALITAQGWLPTQHVIPPLERCLDLVSVTVVLYAFLPRDNRIGRLTRSACLINLALALVVYGAFAPLWISAIDQSPLLNYNGYWQELVWEGWQILLVLWALVVLQRGAVLQRRLVLSIFVILLIGHMLHLSLHQGPPNIAGWERVSNLMASALLVAITYRAVVTDLAARALDSDRDNSTAGERLPETQRLYEEVERICSSADLPVVLERATQSALTIFDARLCAILLFDPHRMESIQIAAIRRTDGTYDTNQGPLELKSQPVIRRVLMRQKQATVEAGSDDSPNWTHLLTVLRSHPDETLTIIPLLSGPGSVGVLVVGGTSTEWTVPHGQGTGGVLTALIGSTIAHAKLAQQVGTGAARTRPRAGERATTAAPAPAQQLAVRPAAPKPLEISVAQQQLEQARREVSEIEQTVRRLRAELAERNRRLAQLSQSFRGDEASSEPGANTSIGEHGLRAPDTD